MWGFFKTVENNPLSFFEQFHVASISMTGQERGASHPVFEQVNDQAGGSGQGPSAAPFGNDSVTRSKGILLLLFHQLDLRRSLTSWNPYKGWVFPTSQEQQPWLCSPKSSCIILVFTYHLSVLCSPQKCVAMTHRDILLTVLDSQSRVAQTSIWQNGKREAAVPPKVV